ncbi:MAG: hypothetical protein K9J82_20525 [Methylotenera sp.]|jgi:hypothetical protein|nr:hypothetical protein [Methylotenera sp.]
MKRFAGILALVAATLLSGCSSTLKSRDIDAATGRFPTDTLLATDGVKTEKPFQAKYRELAYIKTDGNKNAEYNSFLTANFSKTKAFTKIVKKDELESLIIERKLTDKVSNISDLIGLNQLQKQIGPFLIIEPYVEWKGGYNFFGSIKAIDPETGETVFLVEQTAFNWAGLDDPLFFPLFNAFLEWTKGEKIRTAPKK